MDKSNFETYEFVPNSGAENDQFFVVQDNGTFMISRQPVQFEAQNNQNVKETLETVQVFNVTPQQFLVDVNNSAELISVSDQFIIPDSNLYANSYLLQPGTSTPTEPESNQGVAVEFKQAEPLVNENVVAETNKQTNNCTEITLTDEQYQLLEEKGWILLEISEKMYLLDTLGLHDITTNPKLIEKLKNENQGIGNLKLENGVFVNNPIESNLSFNIETEESKQCLVENDITTGQAVTEETSLGMDVDENNIYDDVKAEIPNVTDSSDAKDSIQKANIESDTRVLVIENENIRRVGNTLKVKTKLSLKDFPEKIVLGKTVNGKNLIAKVIKPTDGDKSKLQSSEKDKPDENSQSLENIIPATNLNSNVLSESEFYALIQHFFQNNLTKCSSADVVTADTIISQLLQIPTFKSSVIDNNLIITKSLQTENSSGESVNKGLTALVTGTVTQIADQWRFVHLPHMLQKMVSDTEEYLKKRKRCEPVTLKKERYDVLHVQISEAKQAVTDVVRVSVTVNKRNILPMHLVANRQKLHLSPIYACSFCAALFDTESELKDHQTNNCFKHEDILTIDMDQFAKTSDYCVMQSGKTKSYGCMQCDAKFNRLSSCKNHLKTHYAPGSPKSQTENNTNKKVYKCNMCSSTYFHPSTLSKHIVSRHIRINS